MPTGRTLVAKVTSNEDNGLDHRGWLVMDATSDTSWEHCRSQIVVPNPVRCVCVVLICAVLLLGTNTCRPQTRNDEDNVGCRMTDAVVDGPADRGVCGLE